MRRVSLTLVAVLFALCGVVRAGEECDKARAEAGEKVAKLVASWQAAVEADKAGCPEERAKLNTEFAAVAKECPFGSRLGATLGFARTVLDAALKADSECSKSCPAAKAETTAAVAEKSTCPASELQAARGKLLRDLQQLVSFAAAATPAAGGCEKACAKEGTVATAAAPAAAKSALCEKKTAEIVASVRKDACEKNAAATLMKEIAGLTCEEKAQKLATAIRAEACEAKAGEILVKAATECCAAKEGTVATAAGDGCCADLLACAKTLKASWEKAGGEFTSMCPQKKKELMASFQSFQAKSKQIALLPETILGIAQGMAALDGMNGKMVEYAKANPDLLKSIPEEARKAYESQCTLIREASEVLGRVTATLKGAEGSGAAKKADTTSAD